MNITLDRIVALIKKLEDEYPEKSRFFRFCMFDDFSGRIEHNDGFNDPILIMSFYGGNSLEDLMKKYGV